MKTPGKVIRELRLERELGQRELGELCDPLMHQSTIGHLEADKRPITKTTAESLARVFGVHPSTIMWPEWEGDLSLPATEETPCKAPSKSLKKATAIASTSKKRPPLPAALSRGRTLPTSKVSLRSSR